MESKEVDSEPYLKSKQHESRKNADSCLEQSALVAEDGADACCEQHDEHYEVRDFLVVSDYEFRSFWSDNGCHTAEEH